MANTNGYNGKLIALEGLDGSGKSTCIDAIGTWASDENADVVTTAEPYTDAGEHEIETASTLDRERIAALSDRRVHVNTCIEPALQRGDTVVTDRYHDSTRAYQQMDEWPDDIPKPSVVIYINVQPSEAMERAFDDSKFETEERQKEAHERYEDLYSMCDNDVRIIDGSQSLSAIKHEVINIVKAQTVVNQMENNPDEDKLRRYKDLVAEQ